MQHKHGHGADGSCDENLEGKLVHPEMLQANALGINQVRSLMAIVAGITAGIVGLTGSKGFLLFVCSYLVTSVALLAKMKFNIEEFLTPTSSAYWFVVDGMSSQILSFIMFWTLSFAMVHIF